MILLLFFYWHKNKCIYSVCCSWLCVYVDAHESLCVLLSWLQSSGLIGTVAEPALMFKLKAHFVTTPLFCLIAFLLAAFCGRFWFCPEKHVWLLWRHFFSSTEAALAGILLFVASPYPVYDYVAVKWATNYQINSNCVLKIFNSWL